MAAERRGEPENWFIVPGQEDGVQPDPGPDVNHKDTKARSQKKVER